MVGRTALTIVPCRCPSREPRAAPGIPPGDTGTIRGEFVRQKGHHVLTIDIAEEPAYWILRLEGELDYGECAAFRMSIDRILRNSPLATIVDLSRLEYLDSSGLGLLLNLSKEYAAQGGRLVLVTNETVENILSLTRLNGIFSTASSMAEAVATVAEKPV